MTRLIYDLTSLAVEGSNLSHITFMEVGHEIISLAFLYLPLIQVGQLSVTGKSMCT